MYSEYIIPKVKLLLICYIPTTDANCIIKLCSCYEKYMQGILVHQQEQQTNKE